MPSSKFTKQEISKLFSSARRCLKHPGLDILLGLRSFSEVDLGLRNSEQVTDLPSKEGRILVITPRRIGNAPTRNKVRRQLKAIYHEGHFAQRGYDCVVIVKPQGVTYSFDELRLLLNKAYESPLKGRLNRSGHPECFES